MLNIESSNKIVENIRMFIRLSLDIYSYANKYQVLIVNSSTNNNLLYSEAKEITNPTLENNNELNPILKLLANLLIDKNT